MSSYIEFPNVRCSSCAGVVGSKFEIYNELISIGYSRLQAFEVLNIRRYCCRVELSNPPVIAATYNYEPNSIVSVSNNTLNSDMIPSSILNDKISYPSLKYVAETLKDNVKVKPRTSAIKFREKIREKDTGESSSSGKILFDMNGNVKGTIPKNIPEIDDNEDTKFDKRKQTGTRYNYEVVGIVDVGAGMQVERISRTIQISEEPEMPSNIKKDINTFLDLDNADIASIIEWLTKRFKPKDVNVIITLLEDEEVNLENKYYKYDPYNQRVNYFLRFYSPKFKDNIKIVTVSSKMPKKAPTNIGKGPIADQKEDIDDVLASFKQQRAMYNF